MAESLKKSWCIKRCNTIQDRATVAKDAWQFYRGNYIALVNKTGANVTQWFSPHPCEQTKKKTSCACKTSLAAHIGCLIYAMYQYWVVEVWANNINLHAQLAAVLVISPKIPSEGPNPSKFLWNFTNATSLIHLRLWCLLHCNPNYVQSINMYI